MSAPTTTFTQNERVLCYHGPLVYEAKILRLENWDETTTKLGSVGPHFFVHYKGWKQTQVTSLMSFCSGISTFTFRWDEWVPASRLLKYNETNIGLAKTLKDASSASTSKNASKSNELRNSVIQFNLTCFVEGTVGGGITGSTAGSSRRKEGRGTKRGRDEDDTSKKPDMKLNVPEILRVSLVDDWEAVTKNNQVRCQNCAHLFVLIPPLVGHTPKESNSD
jgi:mortality factor 4-like protein 1